MAGRYHTLKPTQQGALSSQNASITRHPARLCLGIKVPDLEGSVQNLFEVNLSAQPLGGLAKVAAMLQLATFLLLLTSHWLRLRLTPLSHQVPKRPLP